ncbi:MAG TPA: hypothetical protein VED59_04980 [Acidimicrobiales bacterium]|nr:hypothetical protein [Acidimicrobiales bacterium]
MAGVVSSDAAARRAALAYLAWQHGELGSDQLSVLRLESGWLVELVPERPDGSRVLLMVDNFGVVEEIGSELPRYSVHRHLASLRSPGQRSIGSAPHWAAVVT